MFKFISILKKIFDFLAFLVFLSILVIIGWSLLQDKLDFATFTRTVDLWFAVSILIMLPKFLIDDYISKHLHNALKQRIDDLYGIYAQEISKMIEQDPDRKKFLPLVKKLGYESIEAYLYDNRPVRPIQGQEATATPNPAVTAHSSETTTPAKILAETEQQANKGKE